MSPTVLSENVLNLAQQRQINELSQVNTTNGVDDAQVEPVQSYCTQIKASKNASALKLDNRLDLLKLEDAVEVENASLENVLKAGEVEIVDGVKLGQKIQVYPVDLVQVGKVLVDKDQIVE